ncbi:hypothetical protein HAX54_023048, partial [Datura stramonium]|nr:hypothetical protein [Datura stramonium]
VNGYTVNGVANVQKFSTKNEGKRPLIIVKDAKRRGVKTLVQMRCLFRMATIGKEIFQLSFLQFGCPFPNSHSIL